MLVLVALVALFPTLKFIVRLLILIMKLELTSVLEKLTLLELVLLSVVSLFGSELLLFELFVSVILVALKVSRLYRSNVQLTLLWFVELNDCEAFFSFRTDRLALVLRAF